MTEPITEQAERGIAMPHSNECSSVGLGREMGLERTAAEPRFYRILERKAMTNPAGAETQTPRTSANTGDGK